MTAGPCENGAPAADAAGRGRTVVSERALERIAQAAVLEASRDGGAGSRLAGLRGKLNTMPSRSDVKVVLNGHLATVRLRVSVEYPAPVRAVTRQLRDHVAETIRRLADIDAREVHIEVVRLVVPDRTRP